VNDPTLFEAQGFEARFVGADELAKFAVSPLPISPPIFCTGARFDGERLRVCWYSDLPTPIDEYFVFHFDAPTRTCTGWATRCRLTAEAAACGWDVPGAAGGHEEGKKG